MATIKRALKTKPNNEGFYPIVFRVYHDGKSAEIYSKIYIDKNDWDTSNSIVKRNKNNYKNINSFLNKIQGELNDIINKLEATGKEYWAIDVKNEYSRLIESEKKIAVNENVDFIEFLDECIKRQSPGNGKVTRDTKNFLIRFSGKRVPVYKIDKEYVRNFHDFVKKTSSSDGSTRMRSFKARFNELKELGLATDRNPFTSIKIKQKKTQSLIALSNDEIEKLKGFNYNKYPDLKLSYITFMFSYYALGINFKDVAKLKHSNIKRDKISYIRSKTGKLIEIPRLPEIEPYLEMINNYPKENNDYLFPYLLKRHDTDNRIFNRTNKLITAYNNNLKKIATIAKVESNLTSYVARHSASNKLYNTKVPIEVIKDLLGHDSVKTTEGYIKSLQTSQTQEIIKGIL